MKRLLLAPTAAIVAIFTLSACGAMVLSEGDVEKGVSDQYVEQVGEEPDEVDCPGDLDAEVDKSMKCTLTDGEEEIGLTVTITKVDGSDVEYDIVPDE